MSRQKNPVLMAALLLSISEQMLPLAVSLIVRFANLTSQFEILKFLFTSFK